jgi:hypothetical protein
LKERPYKYQKLKRKKTKFSHVKFVTEEGEDFDITSQRKMKTLKLFLIMTKIEIKEKNWIRIFILIIFELTHFKEKMQS